MRSFKFLAVLALAAVFLPGPAWAFTLTSGSGTASYSWNFSTPGANPIATQSATYVWVDVAITYSGTGTAAPVTMAPPTLKYIPAGSPPATPPTTAVIMSGPGTINPTSTVGTTVTFVPPNGPGWAYKPPVGGAAISGSSGSLTYTVNLSGGGTTSVTIPVTTFAP